MSAERSAFVYGLTLCLLWALIPSLFFPNPPLDVVEGFAWGREMALGYTKHPPMQAWLLELSFRLTGGKTWGAYWLSQISIGLGYLAIWHLARRIGLTSRQAFWAIVLTSVTFYFTLPASEFNPNILQIPVWAGMILFFHKALEKGRLTDWVILGLLAAFGLYTKYFVALLIGAIGLYALVFPSARRHVMTPGPWLAAAVCLLAFAPHLAWLVKTDFITFKYAASRSIGATGWTDHLYNPVNFLVAQIANHAGLFLVVIAGFSLASLKKIRPGIPAPDLENRSDTLFLLWFAFLPLGVVLLASAVTGNEFKQMWGTPMFVLSGILAVGTFRVPAGWSSPKRAFVTAALVQAIFLSIITGQALLEPQWKKKLSRIHYPGRQTALFLSDEWQKETGTPLAYVAGDMWPAAHLTLFAPSRPSMFLDHDPALSPWIDMKDVQKKGVLLVWTGDDAEVPAMFKRLYPSATRQGSKSFPAQASGVMRPVTLNWIIVPPGKVADAGSE
ncbi:glycosyltransferase family 39 protein [Roseibium aggregatum]|uniref:Glycosyltransferase family 39 protein n=1 Tax=Roseibium aggregatum TaxID=187304 RepID=A0A926NZC3_9HYPH|nr:glycosyltransferase family 39 protein [Roseibium aggregatum]MBD1549154.1 glycosyltransferase family 39 protein [Roseibium aggregatum]